jgi:hypothetical protein
MFNKCFEIGATISTYYPTDILGIDIIRDCPKLDDISDLYFSTQNIFLDIWLIDIPQEIKLT